MINYKRIIIIFSLILLCILFSYFVFSRRQINGVLAGYFTGIANFFIISFLVTKIFEKIDEIISSKIIKILIVYLLKIIFFSIVIFLIIKNRNIFGILGFLIGFTLTLVIIFIESLILKKSQFKMER
ncbi:MAG: ATP synthase subunit I [Candidatus Goldbacteria bacterium]|nr:ATP synthase subunit I [Candidatus Goldiibacteriota bacterium]